ncbi:hypothetical protein RND71_043576 [Anisodus tanguticus]|uniref:Phosphoinositide 5-phosphatase n=1 Tax=Anisodus tanguticus TaxID=243964 RepID=A0AAE1QRJ0_9SOLA|nr:hypothetical protein RND71_043576 [Anisodus tanguticus]
MDLSIEELGSPESNDSSDNLSSKSYNSDIFVIGLEEIVDLNASNIVSASTTNQREFLIEFQETISRDVPYVLVTSTQLVGVCLFVFVRPKMASYIRDIQVDQVKTGLGGAAGNKGGVAIRMTFYNSALCFVCSHFAAGQSHTEERNADYHEITRKINFGSNRTLSCHDYIFWCGDFNYRIDMLNEDVRQLIDQNQLDILLENDQLKKSQADEKVFNKFLEGKINFKPTYKLDVHSDIYDTSEKARIPAWTDRVLYCKLYPTNHDETSESLNYGNIEFYGRAELQTSDHRPVVARICCEVSKVNKSRLEKVFEDVVQKTGPIDCSLILKHEDGNSNFNDKVLAKIYQILIQIGGKIALFRFCSDSLMVIFKNPTDALKAFENSDALREFDSKISVRMRTENWLEAVEKEFSLVQSNTVPLCSDNDINTENELDYFSTSIGPACDPSSFCLDDDDYENNVLSEDNLLDHVSSIKNKSPELLIPKRPPPPARLPPPLIINQNILNPLESGFNNVKLATNKTLPLRPAPPPPISIPKQIEKPKLELLTSEKETNSSSSYESELDSSFNMLPPSIPPPPLPMMSSSEDEAANEINKIDQFSPPLPPPRIDSFEDSFDARFAQLPVSRPNDNFNSSFSNSTTYYDQDEEVHSPWQTLPPAPPIPPVDDENDAPPIPNRPKFLSDSSKKVLNHPTIPIPSRPVPSIPQSSISNKNNENNNKILINQPPPQIPSRRQVPKPF